MNYESMSSISVVIVDDQAEMRALVRKLLSRAGGFQIVGEAVNGLDAIEVVGTMQPQAVVLDIAMPLMNGIEAIPRIIEQAPNSQIIVFSSMADDETIDHALKLGAKDYVGKNAPTDLSDRIRKMFAR